MRSGLMVALVALLALSGCASDRVYVVTVAPDGTYQPSSPESMLADLGAEIPPMSQTTGMANRSRSDRVWVVSRDPAEATATQDAVNASPHWELVKVEDMPADQLESYLQAEGAE